jgi:phospholipase/lecithinase/hemolysin
MTASLAGGTDYAVGGAEVTTSVSTPEGTIPSVPEEVLGYLEAHGGKADPHALYILEGGGDDILNATGGSPAALGFKIAAGLAGSELLLRQAGARNFVIPDLLNVALLPAAQANASFAAAATNAVNTSLDNLLQLEQLLEGIKIYRLNVFSLFQSVAADATHFGFTNITTPCINPVTNAICADPDHTLFWDVEHPTEFGHSFFAVLVESRLSQ